MVRLETPLDDDLDTPAKKGKKASNKSAVVLEAQVSLKELFEDSRDIESIMKVAMNGGIDAPPSGLPYPPPTK